MTATLTSIKIEDMKIGRRYVTCREGYEAGWTVTAIRHNGTCMNVIYRNGIETGWIENGTAVAVFCDVEGAE